ncbi:ACP S-malonyltransferase, partial [bacterium]|nr:ACP S-malonyltransferase [candidate division CSSED10-310 bacterium]
SGEIAAVNEACNKCKSVGAKRAMLLPVSGAFHSPLMQSAADAFEKFLEPVSFQTPCCPVISNVSATTEKNPLKIKELLLKQLTSPVRWVDSVASLASFGCGTCLETGPKEVLHGLVKKCDSTINIVSCGTATNIFSLKSE